MAEPTPSSDPVDRSDVPLRRRIADEPSFDFRKISDFGVLWLVNRVVFHPRGFTLALNYEDGIDEPVGWSIIGDGSEPWSFAGGIDDEKFAEVEGLLAQAREYGKAPHIGPSGKVNQGDHAPGYRCADCDVVSAEHDLQQIQPDGRYACPFHDPGSNEGMTLWHGGSPGPHYPTEVPDAR